MKKKTALIGAIGFLALFFIFTILVTTVDVKPIGPLGSEVGLSSMNGSFRDAVGYSKTWHSISGKVGYISFALPAVFAFIGIFQAIKRKSIFKIDSHLFVLAAFYVAVAAAYLAFEIFEINYRPVILDEGLEASYPSTHTLLAICVMTTTIFELNMLLKDRKKLIILTDMLCTAIMAVILVGRILSGVHWLSDIIAGALISGSLVFFYLFGLSIVNSKRKNENAVND